MKPVCGGASSCIMPLMMTCAASVADMNGTIADTFDLVISSYAAACRDYLGRELSREEVIARFGPTEVGMLRRELPPGLQERAIEVFRRCYRENHSRLVRVFDGVPEMLKS